MTEDVAIELVEVMKKILGEMVSIREALETIAKAVECGNWP